MRKPPASDPAPAGEGSETRQFALSLDSFSWQALELESSRLGVGAEELIGFAIVYYLADLDSGRIARRSRPGGPLARDDPDRTRG